MTISLEKLNEKLENQFSTCVVHIQNLELSICRLQDSVVEMDRKFNEYKVKMDNMLMQWQGLTGGLSTLPSSLMMNSSNLYRSKNDIPCILNEPDRNEYDSEYSINTPQLSFYINGTGYYNLVMLDMQTVQKMLDDIASLKDIVKREFKRTINNKIDNRDLILDAEDGRTD